MKARHWLGLVSAAALAMAAALFWLGFETPDGQFWLRLGVNIYAGFIGVMGLAALGLLGVGLAVVLEMIDLLTRRRGNKDG